MVTGQTITAAPPLVSSIQTQTLSFVETGAATYTGTFQLPPKSILLDIVVVADAEWTAATSAALIVGDDDDADGFIASTDLKATALLINESLSLASTERAGGLAGAYATVGSTTHLTHRSAEQISAGSTAGSGTGVITAVIASVGAGTAGRTRVVAVYSIAPSTTVTAV